jgi:hypothetical protein
MGSALMFLQRYWEEGDEFLDRIVTGEQFVNTKKKEQLNNGCTRILPTSPRNSNKCHRTKN